MKDIKFRGYQRQEDGKYALTAMHVLVGNRWLTNEMLGHDPQGDTEWVQYAGLKDKNGVEIYAGDIVDYEASDYWNVKEFTGKRRIAIECSDMQQTNFAGVNFGLTEVIGNIYENAELLKP